MHLKNIFLSSILFSNLMPAQLGAYNLFTAWEQWNINNVNVVSHAVKSIVSPKILPSLVTKEIYNYRLFG